VSFNYTRSIIVTNFNRKVSLNSFVDSCVWLWRIQFVNSNEEALGLVCHLKESLKIHKLDIFSSFTLINVTD